MQIFNKVTNILSELSGVKTIYPQYELQNDLGLDSIQMVTLLIMLEEKFRIVLDESDMNPFDIINVSNVVNLVEKYVGGDSNGENEKEN